jgi:methionyl-tRNA formyltransferase
MKFVFAGDRQISVNILKWIIDRGYTPSALMVSTGKNESHADELIKISNLSEDKLFIGNSFSAPESIVILNSLQVDYFIGIHFPYIISSEVLNIPKIGFLNLHPAYLPYNKGWNTPSWAILDGSLYGATLHFMSEELDEGDIINQKELEIESYDTANTLYAKVLKLEEEVFYESFESIINFKICRLKQQIKGSCYKKNDLQQVREFNLDDNIKVKDFLDKIRALTTNNINEIAYFKENENKIGVKIEFVLLED